MSGMVDHRQARIAICLITYRRPQGLRRALEGVAAQRFDGDPPRVRVIVVDNDPSGSAEGVCRAARATMPWPLDYAVEPRRGIPFARNRSVALARPDSDWIAFLDDDEEPSPDWLAELFRVQASSTADVVTGPVVSRFAGQVPDWATRSQLFQRPRYPTGTRRNRAFTNNVLFRAEIFDRVQPHFDERMVLSGGSDAHFSRRVHRAGFRIVWADRAEVVEEFPPTRATAAWLYQRAYRTGAAGAFIARDLRSFPAAAAAMIPDALYRFVLGGARVAAGGFLGKHLVISGVRQICYGAGLLVGLFGGRHDEYRRTHGS